uniref:Aminoglycoside phosphotransferase domain-containing protein n=1 Tax=Coccidioides posadasii RMSCC 3488 TaxID=454284 RepID=A0A0J6FL82_COCPO|nr:hypothetical protein CPAG_05914 [Coccidioides posadasii RMSCC 3488]
MDHSISEAKFNECQLKFVPTHRDLFPWNILIKDGKITGIVDWEHSGFYPDYVEYRLATYTPYSQLRIPGLERRESFLEVPRSPEDEIMPVIGRKLCFPVDLSLLSARTRLSSGRLFANSQLQQAGVVQDLPDCQMQDFYHSAGFVHRPKVQLRPAP